MSKYSHLPVEQPRIMKIDSITDEAEGIKTFTFKEKFNSSPGQFVMLWIPRLNMKPFGVSYMDEEKFSVTVSNVGEFTNELFKKKEGEIIGIQGPYGTGFVMDKKNTVLVAGGYGTAPLAFLAEELEKSGANVTLIIGARTKSQLVYTNRFKNSKVNAIFCTDDGSFGKKGFTTDALKEVLENDSTIDFVYTVGPEIMMKKVIEITDENNIGCQASLERYMKCGFGVCGQCCVDDSGDRVCKSGPVYEKDYIKKYIKEFGHYKRDGTGKKSS